MIQRILNNSNYDLNFIWDKFWYGKSETSTNVSIKTRSKSRLETVSIYYSQTLSADDNKLFESEDSFKVSKSKLTNISNLYVAIKRNSVLIDTMETMKGLLAFCEQKSNRIRIKDIQANKFYNEFDGVQLHSRASSTTVCCNAKRNLIKYIRFMASHKANSWHQSAHIDQSFLHFFCKFRDHWFLESPVWNESFSFRIWGSSRR